MIRSWADHCSSDEEDSHHHHDEDDQVGLEDEDKMLAGDTAGKLQVDQQEEPVTPDEVVPSSTPASERVYDFPSQPPFTAFVGNLSYHIKEVPQLVEAVTNMVHDRLGGESNIHVLGGRIAFDRTDQSKHRGFGYVEVETLDQLKLLMTLNDGQSTIAGRTVQLDTANHQNHNRRGSQNNSRGSFQRGSGSSNNVTDTSFGSDIDGSKFRGGKYGNLNKGDNNNFNNHHNKRRGSNRNSISNDQSTPQQDSGAAPPAQRPSLKLAPRTKPVDAESHSSASNIFGGATARDEQVWQQRREAVQKEHDVVPAAAKEGQEKRQETASSPSTEDGEKKNKEETKKPEPTDNNDGKGNNRSSAVQYQERRQTGRVRSGRGRTGRGIGGGRNDQGENQEGKKGSRKVSTQHQEKKQQTPEEKTAPSVTKVSTAAIVPPAAPKKTEASNKFALLMDSDSE